MQMIQTCARMLQHEQIQEDAEAEATAGAPKGYVDSRCHHVHRGHVSVRSCPQTQQHITVMRETILARAHSSRSARVERGGRLGGGKGGKRVQIDRIALTYIDAQRDNIGDEK